MGKLLRQDRGKAEATDGAWTELRSGMERARRRKRVF